MTILYSCQVPSGVMYCEAGSQSDDCKTGECKQSYMTGLVSWSNGKCGNDGLAVVTEISGYVKWINEITDSVDYYFRQRLYGDVGYGPHASYGVGNSYGSPRYGSNALNSFGSLSPYYGNRQIGNTVSSYGKYAGYGNTALPYYRTLRPRYESSYNSHHVKSSPYYGNHGFPYNRLPSNSNYRLSSRPYGRHSAPYGGFRLPYYGNPALAHGSYHGGRIPYAGKRSSFHGKQTFPRFG